MTETGVREMTFDKWWEKNSYKFPQADYKRDGHEEVAKAAWNAAVEAADRTRLS